MDHANLRSSDQNKCAFWQNCPKYTVKEFCMLGLGKRSGTFVRSPPPWLSCLQNWRCLLWKVLLHIFIYDLWTERMYPYNCRIPVVVKVLRFDYVINRVRTQQSSGFAVDSCHLEFSISLESQYHNFVSHKETFFLFPFSFARLFVCLFSNIFLPLFSDRSIWNVSSLSILHCETPATIWWQQQKTFIYSTLRICVSYFCYSRCCGKCGNNNQCVIKYIRAFFSGSSFSSLSSPRLCRTHCIRRAAKEGSGKSTSALKVAPLFSSFSVPRRLKSHSAKSWYLYILFPFSGLHYPGFHVQFKNFL